MKVSIKLKPPGDRKVVELGLLGRISWKYRRTQCESEANETKVMNGQKSLVITESRASQ